MSAAVFKKPPYVISCFGLMCNIANLFLATDTNVVMICSNQPRVIIESAMRTHDFE